MSRKFIEEKIGSEQLIVAVRQQKQLNYLIRSRVQEKLDDYVLNQIYGDNDYTIEDDFLDHIFHVLKQDNFKTFYKFLRTPTPSASLVNDKFIPKLERVFNAEDAFFHYSLKGEKITAPEYLETKRFEQKLFHALIFNYNDILVHDMKETNVPKRYFVPIKEVEAIESYEGRIKRIAYAGEVDIEGNRVKGWIYLDSEKWAFYDKENLYTIEIPHDLGECPADYVSRHPFETENDIVRKSLFSFGKGKLERYNFLDTILAMTEANGVIPTIVMPEFTTKKDNAGKAAVNDQMSSDHDLAAKKKKAESPVNVGTIVKVPVKVGTDGKYDMTLVEKFFSFHHAPVEPIKYIKDRVQELSFDLTIDITGSYIEPNEVAKNELQVGKGFKSQADVLRRLARDLSDIRMISDQKMMSLAHGKGSSIVEIHYGTDFFLEDQNELYALYKQSPNPIEKKEILIRLVQNRGQHNPVKAKRDLILYKLLPYPDHSDFTYADKKGIVDIPTFLLQTQFMSWISHFEARYGDICEFWDGIEGLEAERILIINNLITQIINGQFTTRDSTPEGVQGERQVSESSQG